MSAPQQPEQQPEQQLEQQLEQQPEQQTWRALVVAKAPVAGRVKTRLGATVGDDVAAEVAAAALLDTLSACAEAVGSQRCHLSLAGDLAEAVSADDLLAATAGWQVHPQVGDGFDERLARAHADVAGSGPGGVVQVGMDTPQVTPALLAQVAAGLDEHDAVLAPAEDGGGWALALRDPRAASVLAGVPMSTPTTGEDTRAALVAAGLDVATGPSLRDVDELADADAVAAQLREAGAGSRFAILWDGLRTSGEAVR